MSDEIKHECGLAYIRLRKPFSYYLEKYGSLMYGINKLYLLMEKQHNRGQDGAGIATVKLNIEKGYPFMHCMKSNATQPIVDIFTKIGQAVNDLEKDQMDITQDPVLMKGHLPFMGEILMGHLRYGTFGKNNINFCHPFIKRDSRIARNIALAGNFNLINVEELYAMLQIPPTEFQKQSDLAAMIDVFYHYLSAEDEKSSGNADIATVLRKSVSKFDGGFVIGGLIGDGNSFVLRDANGIRPAYYYINDEIIVAASERPAIRTTFNVGENQIMELDPGKALICYKDGTCKIEEILPPRERKSCSFERIYFSRGSDEQIYRERISLGHHLSKRVLEHISNDLKNTIFSYIPNTAEIAFYGLVKGMEDFLNEIKVKRILSWGKDIDPEKLDELIHRRIRQEKIAIKDVKLRTFITEDASRNEMVQHVYDITYGTVRNGKDTLVVIDDSIVRGTTLKESIVKMLARLNPKKIIVVSSAPQIRYPDCYGIDMSKLGDFIAFKAAIELLKERHQEQLLDDLFKRCLDLQASGNLQTENVVRGVYNPFTPEEISAKIAELITPPEVKIPVEVIYQTIEDLHDTLPNNKGDWYFTGNYPTKGGNKVSNQAFMNYMEGKNVRSY